MFGWVPVLAGVDAMVHAGALFLEFLDGAEDVAADVVIAECDTEERCPMFGVLLLHTLEVSLLGLLFLALGFFGDAQLLLVFFLIEAVVKSLDVGVEDVFRAVSVEVEIVEQVEIVEPERSILDDDAVSVCEFEGMLVGDVLEFLGHDVAEDFVLTGFDEPLVFGIGE